MLEFQTIFTWPHLEFQTFLLLITWNSSFCWNSRLFYSWAARGCWYFRLFCRKCFGIPGFFFFFCLFLFLFLFFLSTAIGIPDILSNLFRNSIFFVGKKLPSIGGSDIIWNSPIRHCANSQTGSVSRFLNFLELRNFYTNLWHSVTLDTLTDFWESSIKCKIKHSFNAHIRPSLVIITPWNLRTWAWPSCLVSNDSAYFIGLSDTVLQATAFECIFVETFLIHDVRY